MKTSEVHLNRPVAQTFLSASSRDIPVPCFWLAVNWRPAAGTPERRFSAFASGFGAIASKRSGDEGAPRRRKSRQNPQAGKPALRRHSIGAYYLQAIAFIAIGLLLAGCGRHPSQIDPPPPVVAAIQTVTPEV